MLTTSLFSLPCQWSRSGNKSSRIKRSSSMTETVCDCMQSHVTSLYDSCNGSWEVLWSLEAHETETESSASDLFQCPLISHLICYTVSWTDCFSRARNKTNDIKRFDSICTHKCSALNVSALLLLSFNPNLSFWASVIFWFHFKIMNNVDVVFVIMTPGCSNAWFLHFGASLMEDFLISRLPRHWRPSQFERYLKGSFRFASFVQILLKAASCILHVL